MKTFRVSTHGDVPYHGTQLATFAHYVQGQQFRFVILHMPNGEISLTERASGKRVAVLHSVTPNTIAANLVKVGAQAIDALVRAHGEAKVRAALAKG